MAQPMVDPHTSVLCYLIYDAGRQQTRRVLAVEVLPIPYTSCLPAFLAACANMSDSMALPSLQALEDCADFAKTVEPFLPQLYELPGRVLHALQGRESFLELYTATNPLVSGFAFSVFLGAVFLVVSEYNKNYSQVDRCWSLLPTFYVAHFNFWARLAGIPSQRLDAALLFGTVWSVSGRRPQNRVAHDRR